METQILIVDEDVETRAQLTAALLGSGFGVSAAGTEDSALFRFGLVQPDVVVLGVLPGADAAWGTLQRLRAVSQVPIVVLAEAGDEAMRIESLRRGADCALRRPVSIRELEARVKALVRRTHSAARSDHSFHWT